MSAIFVNPTSHVRVVAHADDLTFATTETELKRIRSKMSEGFDVWVRSILGSGESDVREIEILGRFPRWTEQGLEYEASGKHR